MKKKLIWLLLLIAIIYNIPVFAQYGQTTQTYPNQWFTKFQEWIWWTVNFQCEQQCVILIWSLSAGDSLQINWTFEWVGNVWYWFLVWQQIYPWEFLQINGWWNISQKFNFSNSQLLSQVPKDSQIAVLVQGNVKWSQSSFQLSAMWLFEKFWNWFRQALEFKDYNPRTINFLEWPIRNGKYINQAFFRWIIWLLWLAVLMYVFSSEKKNKQKAIYFGIWVLVFFRIFFDFFSTVNQVRLYKQTMSATNIMENWRVGRSSDFYQFLDFIKTQVPKWEKWFFLASYPFYFEWKYHIYPDVKFDDINKVKYIFFYNPYWANAPFDFKDPVYNSWTLMIWTWTYSIQKAIERKPYAKIYILNK